MRNATAESSIVLPTSGAERGCASRLCAQGPTAAMRGAHSPEAIKLRASGMPGMMLAGGSSQEEGMAAGKRRGAVF